MISSILQSLEYRQWKVKHRKTTISSVVDIQRVIALPRVVVIIEVVPLVLRYRFVVHLDDFECALVILSFEPFLQLVATESFSDIQFVIDAALAAVPSNMGFVIGRIKFVDIQIFQLPDITRLSDVTIIHSFHVDVQLGIARFFRPPHPGDPSVAWLGFSGAVEPQVEVNVLACPFQSVGKAPHESVSVLHNSLHSVTRIAFLVVPRAIFTIGSTSSALPIDYIESFPIRAKFAFSILQYQRRFALDSLASRMICRWIRS